MREFLLSKFLRFLSILSYNHRKNRRVLYPDNILLVGMVPNTGFWKIRSHSKWYFLIGGADLSSMKMSFQEFVCRTTGGVMASSSKRYRTLIDSSP